MGSFFQFGTLTLSQLDGSVAVSDPATHLYFTRVLEGSAAYRGQPVETWINLANPSLDPAEVNLVLHSQAAGAGTQQVQTLQANRTLPGKRFIQESVFELFAAVDVSDGYLEVEVSSGEGVIGFERIQLQNQETVAGLKAVTPSTSTQALSAQLATVEGLFTNLNLINTSEQSRVVTLTAIDSDGQNISDPVQIQLGAGQQFSEDAGALFAAASAAGHLQQSVFVGSLRVEADGAGVLGDVLFGDPTAFEFAAALPLQSDTFRKAIFSQVANLPGFFTGLAFYNAGEGPAEIEIQVVAEDGTSVGTATRSLAAGQRLSELVNQIVPESDGQAGGYILVTSSQPLIAQPLFGALDGSQIKLMLAVPPTVIQ